jgi:hypothetical protein
VPFSRAVQVSWYLVVDVLMLVYLKCTSDTSEYIWHIRYTSDLRNAVMNIRTHPNPEILETKVHIRRTFEATLRTLPSMNGYWHPLWHQHYQVFQFHSKPDTDQSLVEPNGMDYGHLITFIWRYVLFVVLIDHAPSEVSDVIYSCQRLWDPAGHCRLKRPSPLTNCCSGRPLLVNLLVYQRQVLHDIYSHRIDSEASALISLNHWSRMSDDRGTVKTTTNRNSVDLSWDGIRKVGK